jgi:hypothetical protein
VDRSKRIYRLRIRFDFKDKKSWKSIWNSTSRNPKDMAAYVNKNGLVRAAIEGEKLLGYAQSTLLEIDGHDYVTSQWEASVSVPINPGTKTYKRQADIVGLSLITREEKITIFVDGSMSRRNLTEEEKKFKITEHSLGV